MNVFQECHYSALFLMLFTGIYISFQSAYFDLCSARSFNSIIYIFSISSVFKIFLVPQEYLKLLDLLPNSVLSSMSLTFPFPAPYPPHSLQCGDYCALYMRAFQCCNTALCPFHFSPSLYLFPFHPGRFGFWPAFSQQLCNIIVIYYFCSSCMLSFFFYRPH